MQGLLTDAPAITANDLVTAKNMADALHKHYPGHLWAVSVNGKQGIADIRNLALSGDWGFRLVLKDYFSASDYDRAVVRAGGELLERYRQRRGAPIHDHIEAAPLDFTGRMKADHD